MPASSHRDPAGTARISCGHGRPGPGRTAHEAVTWHMNWRSQAVHRLAETVTPALPAAALVAAVAADEDGYAVKLSDDCPLEGRFEIGSITKTMTGTVLAAVEAG